MPTFNAVTDLACPLERVWAFLCCPANVVEVTPPELHLRLLEGPESLSLGARFVVQVRRFGISQRVVSEVTRFEPGVTFTDEQVRGPFGKFAHTHRIEAYGGGTRMTDQIDYAPPGGVLGLVLTAARIEGDLKWMFEYRTKRMKEILKAPA